MIYDFETLRRYTLLNMINHLGPISRTALIDFSGYRPATVSAYVNGFIEKQIVVESDSISSGRGRNRALLSLNKSKLVSICISFSPKSVTLIVAQSDGKTIASEKLPFVPRDPDSSLIPSILEIVGRFRTRFSDRIFIGVGVCLFLFEYESTVKGVRIWIEEQFMPRLRVYACVPTYFFNEVSLPSIAEKAYGVAAGKQNFIWVNMANEITASLYCNGHAITGANNAAGALGHTVVDYHRHEGLCSCGRQGCIAEHASWPHIAKQIGDGMKKGVSTRLSHYHLSPDELTISDVRLVLDEGDRLATHYVRLAAEELGLAIANVVNLLNPELIVMHGYMLRLGDAFKEPLKRTILESILPENAGIEIRISNDFENPMLLGVSAEIFLKYLRANEYPWIYNLPVESHM